MTDQYEQLPPETWLVNGCPSTAGSDYSTGGQQEILLCRWYEYTKEDICGVASYKSFCVADM